MKTTEANLPAEVLTEYDLAREPVYVIDDDVPMTLRLKILNQVSSTCAFLAEDKASDQCSRN